jgi:hypothetical protein
LRGPGGADAGTVELTMIAPESPAAFAEPALAAGVYRIGLADAEGARAPWTGKFQVVPKVALPPRARALLQRDWPRAARDRLLAASMADVPSWRYAALLYAARADDAALVAGLFNRDCR